MRVFGRYTLVLVLLQTSSIPSNAYTWPSPQYDALEALLYEGQGLNQISLSNLVDPCLALRNPDGFGDSTTAAARWLRFAFHDMATHNTTDGTGGLDASILFELDRPENIGEGMKQTALEFEPAPTKYVSRADVIAIAAILAVAACEGPIIPFRGGRIDALSAGRAGVPEPHQDLKTHIEAFRHLGFNQQEMIGLIACGHTLGGVNAADFPEIVPPRENRSESRFQFFDSSELYDEKIVSEYLDGSTTNPLVIASNRTFASDARIFSSDNNVTMKILNSQTSFSQGCTSLLERMINTVPSSVNLTEEIKLLPAKVNMARLTIEDNQLVFQVNFRHFDFPKKGRSVRMFWCDRRGSNIDCANSKASVASPVNVLDATLSQIPRTTTIGSTFTLYQFVVPIDPARSVSRFWFEVDNGRPNPSLIYDNEGAGGYVLPQDVIIYVPRFSTFFSKTGEAGNKISMQRHVAGIRSDVNISQAFLSAFSNSESGFPPPLNITTPLIPNSTFPPMQGYTFHSAEAPESMHRITVDLSVVVDGTTFTEDYLSTLTPPVILPSNPKTVSLKPGSLSSCGCPSYGSRTPLFLSLFSFVWLSFS